MFCDDRKSFTCGAKNINRKKSLNSLKIIIASVQIKYGYVVSSTTLLISIIVILPNFARLLAQKRQVLLSGKLLKQ